jgi:hypothetical protein
VKLVVAQAYGANMLFQQAGTPSVAYVTSQCCTQLVVCICACSRQHLCTVVAPRLAPRDDTSSTWPLQRPTLSITTARLLQAVSAPLWTSRPAWRTFSC